MAAAMTSSIGMRAPQRQSAPTPSFAFAPIGLWSIPTYRCSGLYLFERKPDLAFNHISEGAEWWPRGFGAEVLSAELLYWIDSHAVEAEHREHVTLYVAAPRPLYDRPGSLPAIARSGIAD